MLLTALVAIEGFGKVFGSAIGAKFGVRFSPGRMTAAGAKIGIGRHIFAAMRTFLKNDLLVAAHGTKFRAAGYGMLTLRA